jgi:cytidylate kinase
MNSAISFDKCLAFINCQMQPAERPPGAKPARPLKLAVTLSRQTGSGALLVAERLAQLLQERAPAEACAWTVFDRNLVQKVLEDHRLPKQLAQFMPEDRVSQFADMMQELLGLHPPSSTLVSQTTETILKLADLGNVILVGRGAHVITSKLSHVFHARLIGSLEKRAQRVQEHLHLDREAALAFIEKEDRGRERYLRIHFQANINDPLLYHLIINTDRMRCDDAAHMIADAALCHRERAG